MIRNTLCAQEGETGRIVRGANADKTGIKSKVTWNTCIQSKRETEPG